MDGLDERSDYNMSEGGNDEFAKTHHVPFLPDRNEESKEILLSFDRIYPMYVYSELAQEVSLRT